ncbi:hypothetical protein LS73_003360 [Helicobacter muridarum]|uniref:Outer membrane protein beta-barrel domain-containing protein n=1 Tax=Helicobacter muridarum TaxID=216 RepID=A0A099TYD5_9HELI|nr:hypothetical protein [Helicobacter muridarum]TLE00947.1 hypothetical protein LS73_003360 [Helicobacter muridarum]STQ86731.1 Uncharacterised protein [Helicobacter muridarum]
MKKLNLTLISTLAFMNAVYADSSDRFAVFFLGGGVNGIYNISRLTELQPVDYSSIANTFPNFSSSSNVINRMCKSGTCDLSSLGGGLGVEAGVKLRPFSFLEFDLWVGFDYSAMLDSGDYPNSIKLKKEIGGFDYKNTYKDGEYDSVWPDLMHFSFNATATFRVKRFGFTGGIGASIWDKSYNIKLKRQKDFFNDEKEEKNKSGGANGVSLDLILGLSYRLGENKGTQEIVARFVMPFREMVHQESGNNGYVDYNERTTLHPYMINIFYRHYF